VVIALIAGLSVARIRTELAAGSAASAPPGVGLSAVPSAISREQAIAVARARDVGRVDRIEAKLMTYADYVQVAGRMQTPPGDPQASRVNGVTGILGDPATRYVWVVAISGEVWPNGRTPIYWGGPPPVPDPTPYPPYRWGMFLVDAAAGQLMWISDAGVAESWPAAFDRLLDHPAASSAPAVASPLASALRVAIRGPEAMVAVMKLTGEVRRIDRIEVKLTTRGEFEIAQPSGMIAFDPIAPLWVVALSGDIMPAFAHGGTYASATYLVDANTGMVIGMTAAGDRWPASFDALPSHATQ
jgi:hypothetical protein